VSEVACPCRFAAGEARAEHAGRRRRARVGVRRAAAGTRMGSAALRIPEFAGLGTRKQGKSQVPSGSLTGEHSSNLPATANPTVIAHLALLVAVYIQSLLYA
jgi:hypothetical protein